MPTLPKTLKRLLIGLPLALLALFLLWVFFGPVAVYHPEAGRWRPSNEDTEYAEFERVEFKIFEQIAEQQPHDITHGQNLRFMFQWPRRKWVTFAQRADGGAEVVVAESMMTSDGKFKDKLDVRTFGLDAKQYREFLTKFDDAASGYRFAFVLGFDGEAFGYERWKNGAASHYEGNASFVRKDYEVLYAVVEMVRSHSGFAEDGFSTNHKFAY